MNRLVLIDGNAILHRAYHALPPLTAPDGSIVNAVYGFVSILLKLYSDFHPTHMAVAFDRPAPTFRKKLFKDYQIQRPKMEDALVSQIDKVHDVITSFGIPIYELDGFEADDIIGTIASRVIPATEPGSKEKEDWIPGQARNDILSEVIIVTGDRDLLQLVDEHIKVFMPVKGLSEGKVFDETSATEKFGVPPKKIPDYKGLAGDASDNYPGVAGIGPKTAVKLINQYGSLEKIIKSGELGDKAESALLSKDLATIRTDAPIDVSFDAMKIATLVTPQSRMKLAEFGFKTLLKRMSGETEMIKSEQQPLF